MSTLPLRGRACACGTCHQRFNSVSAFDLHRVGSFGVDRRCLRPPEMLAIGMSQNARGLWIERRREEWQQKRRPLAQETTSHTALGMDTATFV